MYKFTCGFHLNFGKEASESEENDLERMHNESMVKSIVPCLIELYRAIFTPDRKPHSGQESGQE